MQLNDGMQGRRTLAVVAGACCLAQLALVPHVGIANGRANLMLVLAAVAALRFGGRTGVVTGFLAGLLFDLTTTGPIGLMAFELTVCAFVLGRECRNRLAEEGVACVATFAAADGAVCLAYNLAMLLVGESRSLFGILFLRALPSFVLTLLCFLPFLYALAMRPGSGPSLSGRPGLGAGRGRHLGGRL